MNLKSWAESGQGRAMALAKAIDVPPSFVSKMASGDKPIPAKHCQAIYKFTNGEVTIPEMRDDFAKYWPELAMTSLAAADTPKAQPDQPATQNVATQGV